MGEFEKYFREEGLKEGLKKGIEEGLKKGIEEGRKAGVEEGRLNSVKALMKNAKVSAQEAMKILDVPSEEQQKLLPLL